MNIIEEKIDDLNQIVTINIEKEDYQPRLEDSLKDLRKKASLKGFRPGKVPVGLIRKMYGNAVLAEELDKIVRSELTKYLKDNELNILGAPIPKQDDQLDLNIQEAQDYSFSYELGLSPTIDLSVVSDSTTVTNHRIKVEQEMVDEEWNRIRKQHGNLAESDEAGEGDLISLKLIELEDDGSEKSDGVTADTVINQDMIVIDKLAKEVLGKKVGDHITFADLPAALNREKKAVLQYMLGIKEGGEEIGNSFRGEITSIRRNSPAEVNKDFFDKVFGPGEVDSEESARKSITEQLQNAYDSRTDRKLHDDIVKALLDASNIELPEEFLRKWLETEKENNEEVADQEFEYFRRNLKWSLIYNRIAKEQEFAVERPELEEAVKADIARYYGQSVQGFDDEQAAGLVNKLLEDQQYMERAHSTILDKKVFDHLKQKLHIADKLVSKEEYERLLTEESNEQ